MIKGFKENGTIYKMVNYSDGKIYAIKSPHTAEIYIGSTCNSLSKRFTDHLSGLDSWSNRDGSFCSSYIIMSYPDSYIELLENFKARDRKHLNRREGQYIKDMTCVNCVKHLTEDETKLNIRFNKKEVVLTQEQQRLKEHKRQYDIIYREKNAIKKQDNDSNYRKTNKEYIKLRRAQIGECECGSVLRLDALASHKRTIKHIFWMTISDFIYS